MTAHHRLSNFRFSSSASCNPTGTRTVDQLRLLQTIVEVAAEKNSRVIIVPVPVELLRFLDRVASAAGRAQRPVREAQPRELSEVGIDAPGQDSKGSALPQEATSVGTS